MRERRAEVGAGKAGRAVIVATHLVERAGGLLEHGLLLEAGRPAWVGPAAELPGALGEAS